MKTFIEAINEATLQKDLSITMDSVGLFKLLVNTPL